MGTFALFRGGRVAAAMDGLSTRDPPRLHLRFAGGDLEERM